MSIGPRPETRQAILLAAYECLARFGPSKTSVADVALGAGVSRATLYRYFPGGRDELLRAVVHWEHQRFFLRLYDAVSDALTLEEVIERGLLVARRAIEDHEVLQMVLATEPAAITATLVEELTPTRIQIAAFLVPYLEHHELADGVDVDESASFLARMVLSYLASPGRWDLDDPAEVARLVRTELLAGIVPAG